MGKLDGSLEIARFRETQGEGIALDEDAVTGFETDDWLLGDDKDRRREDGGESD